MYRRLFLFLFVLTCFMGFAQETEKTAIYFTKGAQYIGNNKDSAYFYFNKTIALAEKTDQIDYLVSGYAYLIYANSFYFDLGNFKNNLEKFETFIACDPRFENIKYKTYHKNKLLIAKGNYQYKLGSYDQAEQYFKQVYKRLKTIPKNEQKQYQIDIIKSILQFLPAIYREKGKYKLAEDYYNILLDFLKTNRNQIANPESSMALAHVYLAKLFQAQKEYQKSEEFIRKALHFYQSDLGLRHPNSAISAHHVLVKNYLFQYQPDSALVILKKIDEEKWIAPENLKFSIDQTKYKARAFEQKNEFETALQRYQKALETTQKYYQTQHHAEIAELYAEIAEVHAEQYQFEKSLSTFQKALSTLSEDFESTDFSDNPKPKKVLSKLSLIEILGKKQKVLAQTFQYENKLDYLKAANQTAKDLVTTLDALKPEFESKVDMQFLLEETYPTFYQMMETAFLLHETTGKQSYMEDAFYFSEKSKAVLLLSAVQKTGATQFAGVPDSIINQEKQYRATINHLEKKRFKNTNDEQLGNKLFDLKNEFYAFLDKIETNYPKYHRLKYKTEVATLPEIQNLLQPEEAMLDYYLTDEFLYCFVIEKENILLERIPFSENSSQRILQLQKYFSSPQVTKMEELKTLSNQVYEELIPKINASVSSLIVLRSGMLNYIPFGALFNTEKQKYLIEEYAISYANSATLYQEYFQQKNGKNPRILAFAPSFLGKEIPEEARAGLGQLLYNKKEVKLISDYFDGKILLDDEASLRAFENNAKNFGILHLATHAIINDKNPDYSYLAFAPKSDSLSNLLYIQDLYNYDLNADLVVLSACETGVGRLQKGEGMLSLARGFNYAGASSLVTTQWKIDDESSSFLMKNFYKNLANGESKSAALRHAKLHYLDTTEDAMLRHPYYWAGFVLTGNTSAVVESHPKYWMWLGLGIFVLVLFLSAKRISEKTKRQTNSK